jgi:hypothetical protein
MLKELQESMGEVNMENTQRLQVEAQVLMEKEETKWRQRAKEIWLKCGDKNSKYFHVCAAQRCCASFIHGNIDERGVFRSSLESVEEAFINYFKGVLASSSSRDLSICEEVIPKKVSEEMNQKLLRVVTEEEVNKAINQMGPLKSLGPDGLPAAFYQDHWQAVGKEVFLIMMLIIPI